MKIIAAGSRSKYLTDPFQTSIHIHERLSQLPAGTTVVHGASPGGGIDHMADQAARSLGFAVIAVPITDDDRLRARDTGRPKFTPLARTIRMFDEHPDAELVIVWHAHNSPGSAFTIQEARRRNIPVEVYAL